MSPSHKPTRALIDNWSLQCAGSILTDGVSGEQARTISSNPNENNFSYKQKSNDIINFLSLDSLLYNIVMVDSLIIDTDYSNAWDSVPSFNLLTSKSIISPYSFSGSKDLWQPSREIFANDICTCQAMRDAHNKNVESYRKNQTSIDNFLAQIVWGGAGMLARADYLSVPYVPHPVRSDLLIHSVAFSHRQSAPNVLKQFIDSQRVRVFGSTKSPGYTSEIHMPPISAMVIQEARSADQIIPIALQMRDRFSKVRKWLSQFQYELDSDSTIGKIKHQHILSDIAQNIESTLSQSALGKSTVQFGTSGPKITANIGSAVGKIRNRMGIRATINKLILSPSGLRALNEIDKTLRSSSSSATHKFKNDLSRHLTN